MHPRSSADTVQLCNLVLQGTTKAVMQRSRSEPAFWQGHVRVVLDEWGSIEQYDIAEHSQPPPTAVNLENDLSAIQFQIEHPEFV